MGLCCETPRGYDIPPAPPAKPMPKPRIVRKPSPEPVALTIAPAIIEAIEITRP